jgi:EAL domain-containing protein (putative c-di-GMP-specific phosphodiesterase class I)
LGDWTLKTVCEQLVTWQKEGLSLIPVAVNCSGKQLEQDNFIDKIKRILIETRLEPSWLKLELTESLLVKNIEATLDKFQHLHQLGVKIDIDDFGTGYASLGYLQHFPFDTLKIDRSFVRNLDQNEKNAAITTAIIQMSHRLNFQVIAEGVETIAEKEFLAQHNCDIMQGYLFSYPLPPADFKQLLIQQSTIS